MKKIFYWALLVIFAASCKPTEKNYADAYSKAYEAARKKTDADQTGEDGVKLELMDGPTRRPIGADTVSLGSLRVKPFGEDPISENGNYGIAIAKYSMPTNARSHLNTIKSDYPNAFLAFDGSQGYYVIIKTVASVPEAADPIRIYRANHPNDLYMGLDGEPVVYFVSYK